MTDTSGGDSFINNEIVGVEAEVIKSYTGIENKDYDANAKNAQVYSPGNIEDKNTISTNYSMESKEGVCDGWNSLFKSADENNKKTLFNQEIFENLGESPFQEDDLSYADTAASCNESNLQSDENLKQSVDEPDESASSKPKKHHNRPNEGIEEAISKEDFTYIRKKRIGQNGNVYFMFKKDDLQHNDYFVSWESFVCSFGDELVWVFPISFVLEGVFFQDPGKRLAIFKAFTKSVLFRDKSE